MRRRDASRTRSLSHVIHLLIPPALPLQVDEQLGGDSTSASLATHDLSPDGWRSVVERLGWWSAEDGETSEALHRQVKRAQALLAQELDILHNTKNFDNYLRFAAIPVRLCANRGEGILKSRRKMTDLNENCNRSMQRSQKNREN